MPNIIFNITYLSVHEMKIKFVLFENPNFHDFTTTATFSAEYGVT